MRNDNFMGFGDEIGRTIRKVLNGQDFYDIKRMMRGVPGMGGGPFFDGPYDGNFPPLSRDDDYEPGTYKTDSGTYNTCDSAYGKQEVRPYQKKLKGASSVPSTLMVVFGSIGTGVTGLPLLVGTVLEATLGNLPTAAEAVGSVFGVFFVISLILMITGIRLKKRIKRFRVYQKVLNGRTYCPIKELSAASRQEPKYIIKDLRKMISAGLFPEGYLDEQETCLMTDYETYNQYLETMKNAKVQQEAEKREQEKWASREGGAALKETIDEGRNYIKTIKAANDALPEEEISEKLEQLELVTSKIFDYVEHHPEKLPEIRKFMSYYMPITLKLVTAYQRFERHGTDTSEVADTKLEIKGTLDTINKAYQNLLKKLMQTDILDVSSDISALETILAQEGLTGDEITDQSKLR